MRKIRRPLLWLARCASQRLFSPARRELCQSFRTMATLICRDAEVSALALGGGSMIGYRKVVVTLGEKIGSSRMNPAQGTAAQVGRGQHRHGRPGGLPVSTTHVLSSAVVGTVVATPHQHINQTTILHIVITWVTTLPGTMLMAFATDIVFHLAFAG